MKRAELAEVAVPPTKECPLNGVHCDLVDELEESVNQRLDKLSGEITSLKIEIGKMATKVALITGSLAAVGAALLGWLLK